MKFIKSLLGNENGEAAFQFIIGCAVVLGILNLILYLLKR